MKKITNGNVKKECQKKYLNIVISILIIAISFIFLYLEEKTTEELNNGTLDLNSIIVSSEEKNDKKAYINAESIPYKFAGYDDTTDSYYIIFDEKYMYIAYMTEEQFEDLNNEDIYENPIRIEGITKTTTSDVKEIAIEAYNDNMENEEDKLTIEDFENYFGSVYLDMTAITSSLADIYLLIFVLLLFVGGIYLLVTIIQLFKFNSAIKKISENQIDELDNEMNRDSAFYYEKAHLYLTDNYIINFGGTFRVIKYQDILWMYPFEQRVNGIKSSQSIKVLLNNGKTYTIASIELITKKKKEVFNEIFNTILNKNNKMLVGYTNENIKLMKDKIKEIKSNK